MMEYLTITPCRLATWFCLALASGLALRLYLGPKQSLYFKHAHHQSLITMKGQIAHFFFIGRPKNIKGVLYVLLLIVMLIAEAIGIFMADFDS